MIRFIGLILLLFASIANAGSKELLMAGNTPAGTSPPAWYADTNVVFSWSGATAALTSTGANGFDSSGNEVTGTLTNGDIGTYQTRTALRIDALNEYIQFSQTANQFATFDSDQTVCIGIYATGAPSENTTLFAAGNTSNSYDQTTFRKATSNGLYDRVYSEGSDLTYIEASGASTQYEDWETWSFSTESLRANGNHSVNAGDLTPWSNSWEEDADELDGEQSNDFTVFYIGNPSSFTTGVVESTPSVVYYIDRYALVNSYEFDCTTLTGW
jgi:hypothetical protein